MKDQMSEFESMNCDKRELCYLAQTLCLLTEVKFGGH